MKFEAVAAAVEGIPFMTPLLGRRVAVYGGGNTALDAARTARRTASATASGSRRRPRGIDWSVSITASFTASAMRPPSRSRSGTPIKSSDGSSTNSPLSVMASST